MPQHDLAGPDVAGLAIDQRRSGAADRVCAVDLWVEASKRHPLLDQLEIGPFTQWLQRPAWWSCTGEEIICCQQISRLDVALQKFPGVAAGLKHNSTVGVLLGLHRLHAHLIAHLTGQHHIVDPQPHQVTPAQTAVDGDGEHRPISQA